MDEEIDVYAGEVDRERFVVKDIATADWALAKTLDAQQRIEDRTEYAKQLKARIDKQLADANKEDESTVAFMLGLIEPWARTQIEGQKSRTVKLIAGKVGFRKLPDKLEIEEDALIEWAWSNAPEIVRVKKSIDKPALKKLLEKTEVPHVIIDVGIDRMYVE